MNFVNDLLKIAAVATKQKIVSFEYSHYIESIRDKVYVDDQLVTSYKKGAYRTIMLYGQTLLLKNNEKIYVNVSSNLSAQYRLNPNNVPNPIYAVISTRTTRPFFNQLSKNFLPLGVNDFLSLVEGESNIILSFDVAENGNNVTINKEPQLVQTDTVDLYDNNILTTVEYKYIMPMGLFNNIITNDTQLRLIIPPVDGEYLINLYIENENINNDSTLPLNIPTMYVIRIINKKSLDVDCDPEDNTRLKPNCANEHDICNDKFDHNFGMSSD